MQYLADDVPKDDADLTFQWPMVYGVMGGSRKAR